jgi:alpha-glucosidase (family GH31 glycosyl hydrolase)
MMRGLALGLTLAAGCGPADGLPERWHLEGEDAALEVQRAPFVYCLVDGASQTRLCSLPGGQKDGQAALAWTSGRTAWEHIISPGYFALTADLDPWRDDFEVVAARQDEGALELELGDREAPGDLERRLRVRLVLRPGALRVEAERLSGRAPRAWAAGFHSPSREGFLGLGERFNRTDQRGLDVYGWAEEGGIGGPEGGRPGPDNPYPNGEAMTYFPVPFFLSSEGYGFWLDSTWYHVFELASAREDAWRVWHLGPRLAFEIFLPRAGDPRPWPHQLVDAFTARTGRPRLPPKWAFGPRRRVNRGDRQAGLHELEAMRALDLPLTGVDDAVHFLPRGSHVGREAELAAWTAFARGLGYRVCGYYNPYLALGEDSPLRALVEEGLARGHFLVDGEGKPSEVWMVSGTLLSMLTVDVTEPEAVAWYQGMLDWAIELGYSGWMTDFGEYVRWDVRTRSGMTGEELHNLFPVLYHQAVADHLDRSPLRGEWLTFVRSGYTGDAAHSPMTWGGDPAASFESSDGLPSMVRAGINMGVSGVPFWGGDIHGFHCVADGYAAADEELLVRWIQHGALTPNMQDQDACVAARDQGRKANIFDDPLAQAAWRTYARLHTRLFPYLYSLAWQAHETGVPLIRHLFLEHPDEPALRGADDAYYLGPALLVAPVVERGARAKRVHLPAGLYLDWAAGALVPGGRTVELHAPLERLPLLLRSGELVPLLDPAIDTLADEEHPEVVGPGDVADVLDVVGLLAPGDRAEFVLWDGGRLEARWQGIFTPGGLVAAGDEAALATCRGCYLETRPGPDLRRVRVSLAAGVNRLEAGGLRLVNDTGQRLRWDLYLAE